MIVLDTNVISDVTAPKPNERVLARLLSQSPELIFTTAITQAEIVYGIRILPDGKRHNDLENAAQAIFFHDMRGRVLSFHVIAAGLSSRIASVATRNVADFNATGIEVINPWDHPG